MILDDFKKAYRHMRASGDVVYQIPIDRYIGVDSQTILEEVFPAFSGENELMQSFNRSEFQLPFPETCFVFHLPKYAVAQMNDEAGKENQLKHQFREDGECLGYSYAVFCRTEEQEVEELSAFWSIFRKKRKGIFLTTFQITFASFERAEGFECSPFVTKYELEKGEVDGFYRVKDGALNKFSPEHDLGVVHPFDSPHYLGGKNFNSEAGRKLFLEFRREAERGWLIILTALNLLNQEKECMEKFGPTEAQAQRRERKGREPIDSYYVLKIPGDYKRHEGESLGLWHNRLHGVRGHKRRYRNGKVVWIPPHERGKKSLGKIIKDYRLRLPKSELKGGAL